MKCMVCKNREAEFILYDSHLNRFEAVCKECLDNYTIIYGELQTTFWNLPPDNAGLLDLLERVNDEISFWKRRYYKLLKKREEGVKNKVNKLIRWLLSALRGES